MSSTGQIEELKAASPGQLSIIEISYLTCQPGIVTVEGNSRQCSTAAAP
jgi:hypothetical protein